MTLEEIKLRQMTNQYLVKQTDKFTAVRDLCGFQAQFMVNALHSIKIRCYDYNENTVRDGLVKNWTVRGTVHVFAEDDLSLFKHCNNGKSYHLDEWQGFVDHFTREWTLTPERQKLFSGIIINALKKQELTREELKEVCIKNGMTETEKDSMFDQWGGGVRDMCERGFMNYVVKEKKAFCISPPFNPLPEEQAKLEIARRYFTNMGPATIRDTAYYFGTTQARVKEWLQKLPVKSIEVINKTFFYIENRKSYDTEIPECVLLAGFDQLMLCYQKADSIYLPQEHVRGIFNLAGIVMPAVLLRGRIVGSWKKKNKKLIFTLFESISDNDKKAIVAESEKLWGDIKSIEWK